MKSIFLVFLVIVLHSFCGFSQEKNVELVTEKSGNTIVFYAQNNKPFTQSISLMISGKNIKKETNKPVVKVIEANKKVKLSSISFTPGKKYSYKTNYTHTIGNILAKPDDYLYDLPFEKGTSHRVDQTYNGSFSHYNRSAIDFNMPIGTTISAMREGIVIALKEDSKRGCATEDCRKESNYIKILHSDGTIAEYDHLQYSGVLKKVGDKVSKGEVIAKSGNTGWSNGPHLHVEVYIAEFNGKKTVKTKFRGYSENNHVLKKGQVYLSL